MKFIYGILILLIAVPCTGQNNIIVGEFRLGNRHKSFIPYNYKDKAKFCIGDKKYCQIKIGAKLFSKEDYYLNKKGTGIEFHIDQKHFSKSNTVEIYGTLYTDLNEEEIRGEFDHPITIDLNNNCRYVGGNVYRMDNEIPILAPEKYSLASITNYLNKNLYTGDDLEEFYKQDVIGILNYKLDSEARPEMNFLSRCYEIYDLILPFMKSDLYVSEELKKLDAHINDLNLKINEQKNRSTATADSLQMIERDKFESELVKREYEKLHRGLLTLKVKIESIIFKDNHSSKGDNEGSNKCDKNVDFRFGGAISLGSNAALDQFKTLRINQDSVELFENPELSNYSFAIAGMTNFYLKKRFNTINPGLALGLGATFQNEEINLVGYLGGTIALGKSRMFVLNFGMSYLPREEFIADFMLGDRIATSIDSEEMFTRKTYGWAPFLALSIGIPSFASDRSESKKNVNLGL